MWRDLIKEIGGTALLLFVGIVFFTIILIFVEWRFQSDAVVYQTVAGLVTGFAGAFWGILKGKTEKKEEPAPGTPAPEPTVKVI